MLSFVFAAVNISKLSVFRDWHYGDLVRPFRLPIAAVFAK